MRVCVLPSVYEALKYLTETVTAITFFKIILSHSFLSEPGQATVKYFNKFSKFHKFLKMDVSHKNAS